MSLSEDQRALLALLLSGESEDSIAALMGTEAAEVRSRARAALTELAGRDPDELIEGLSDQLLGQLGSERRAAVAAAVDRDAEARALAERTSTKLEELRLSPAARGPTQAPPAERPFPGASRFRRAPDVLLRPAVLLGAGAAVLLVVAAVVSGVFSGEDEPAPPPESVEEDVIVVELERTGSAPGRGAIRLARIEDLPVLDLDISGLTPSAANETYVLWLFGSQRQAFPVAFRDVGENGRIEGRVEIPSAASSLLPSIGFLDLSLARRDQVTAEIEEATQGQRLPAHVGASVLRGDLG